MASNLQILTIPLGLSLLGLLISKALAPRLGGLHALALAYPLGSGSLSLAMFMTSWLGASPDFRAALVVYFIMVLPLACLYFLRQLRNIATKEKHSWSRYGRSLIQDLLACGVFFSLASVAGYLAVWKSYSTWDAMSIWGIKGYAIAYEGTILAAGKWGSHGLSYPLNIPLQISLFSILGGDALPASKLISPSYYFSLLLGVYAFHMEQFGKPNAFMASLAVGTLPIIFMHATMGYANLPFAFYIAFGVLALYQAYGGGTKSLWPLGGILLGLAVWTRPEGLFMTAMIWAAFLATILILKRELGHRHWASSVVLFLVVILPWQVFLNAHGVHPMIRQAPATALASMRRGDLNLEAFYWIFRFLAGQLIDPSVWGVLLPLSLVVLVANHRRAMDIALRDAAPLTMLMLAVGLSMVGYYYLVSFVGDLKFWLGSGVNRMFLPAGILGAIWVFHVSMWADVNESA